MQTVRVICGSASNDQTGSHPRAEPFRPPIQKTGSIADRPRRAPPAAAAAPAEVTLRATRRGAGGSARRAVYVVRDAHRR